MQRPCGRTKLSVLKEQIQVLTVHERLVKEMRWGDTALDFIKCEGKPSGSLV